MGASCFQASSTPLGLRGRCLRNSEIGVFIFLFHRMYYQQDLAVYFQSGGGEIHLFLLKTPLRFLSLFVREPREDNRENGGRGVRVENPVGESHLKLLTTFKGKKEFVMELIRQRLSPIRSLSQIIINGSFSLSSLPLSTP